MQYFIQENFYFDIDHQNQFRITGPENHLLFGMTFPNSLELEVVGYEIVQEQLQVSLRVPTESLSVHIPIVTDIRTIRTFTEGSTPRPTYQELVDRKTADILPQNREEYPQNASNCIRFYNQYQDESGTQKIYGSQLCFPSNVQGFLSGNTLHISGKHSLLLHIATVGNIQVAEPLTQTIFRETQHVTHPQLLNQFILDLFSESERHIEHLVHARKTSSFEYGTIFPRDWIESADLGRGDLSTAAVDYMYEQSMLYVSETGEGWHEDAIGEFRTKVSAPIDRKMIDIEPHYILGTQWMSKQFLTQKTTQEKLKRVAEYLVKQAGEQELIYFKKVPHSETEYHYVGNWRDSYYAFPRQKSPLAPYDVNCVFYPMALRVIRDIHDYFQVASISKLDQLIERWDQQKDAFRLYHPEGLLGYSLALHGRKNIPLPIPHLDESYDLFYGTPSLEEVVSFAKKLIDPDFFYTPVGPLLVAADDDSFTTSHYHGKVIWPKQAAFAVAGLGRQYRRGLAEGWAWPVLEQIKESLTATCEACFQGWQDLGGVPELYYYSQAAEQAKFYTDQEEIEGQMSLIQLWSSVGCRRIIREYQMAHQAF